MLNALIFMDDKFVIIDKYLQCSKMRTKFDIHIQKTIYIKPRKSAQNFENIQGLIS